MRTTQDLIADLQTAAVGAEFAVLVVSFENNSIMVKANEPDAQKRLDELVLKGGIPIGYIRSIRKGRKSRIESLVLPDHSGEAFAVAERVLQQLCANLGFGLERQLGVYAKIIKHTEGGAV